MKKRKSTEDLFDKYTKIIEESKKNSLETEEFMKQSDEISKKAKESLEKNPN